jgi:hypothetical protein
MRMRLTCKDCYFFDEKGSLCRRYAPRPYQVGVEKILQEEHKDIESIWPFVEGDFDWCGEFTPSEPLSAAGIGA